jgi:hypothetical protein
MRPSKDYLIYRDILVTKRCPLFGHPLAVKELDKLSRNAILEMSGVFQRHDPKYEKLTMSELIALTGIKMRWAGGWKKILGVKPKYERPKWGRREEE